MQQRRRGGGYSTNTRLAYARWRLELLTRRVDATVRRLVREGAPRGTVYNYVVLKCILQDVYRCIVEGGGVDAKSTYILPGAIWLARALVEGRLSIDQAASHIGGVRFLARRLLRTLVYGRNLTLIIPSNLSPSDIKVYIWVDKVGYDRNGNPLYTLTMYFSFPFDISELDRRTEFEPVVFLFARRGRDYTPLKAYARVHYDLYVYDVHGLSEIRILFLRFGHTPKILHARRVARVTEDGNPVKEFLDRVWLWLGELLTRLTGVRRVHLASEPGRVHVHLSYRLPRSKSNPFATPVHPYFVDVSLP